MTIQYKTEKCTGQDHCGCCDTAANFNIENYTLKIKKIQDCKKNTINYNHSDEYILPYII